MHGQKLGEAALSGWRKKVATGVAVPVAERTPARRATIEQVIGLVFFVLSVVYAGRTVVKALNR